MVKQKKEIRHGYLEENKTAAPTNVTYDTQKPFGQDNKSRVNFGRKHPAPRANNNPAPGQYETKVDKVKPSNKSYTISQIARNTHEHIARVKKGKSPSIGDYNVAKPFGSTTKNMTMGKKTQEKKKD